MDEEEEGYAEGGVFVMDGRHGSVEKKKKNNRKRQRNSNTEEEEVKVKEDEEKEEEATSSLLLSNDMKDTITKTMPHPLWESSRREFKKLMTTKSQGTVQEEHFSSLTMFGSIDKDIISIIQSLTNIVGTTYDSYTKAGKKILLSASSSIPSNTDASLAKVVAEGNRAKEVCAYIFFIDSFCTCH
jgi:hypothetical protein